MRKVALGILRDRLHAKARFGCFLRFCEELLEEADRIGRLLLDGVIECSLEEVLEADRRQAVRRRASSRSVRCMALNGSRVTAGVGSERLRLTMSQSQQHDRP